MSVRDWDTWLFVMPMAAALVAVLVVNEARAPSFVAQAVAGARPAPAYTITVTAKRLPPECKVAEAGMPAHCDAIRDATTVTARAND